MASCRTLAAGCAVPEQVGQPGPTSGDPGADGARWDAEDGGDLGVVEASQITEDDRGPELGRELLEGSVDVKAGIDRLLGAEGGPSVKVGVVGWDGPAPLAAQLVEGGVHRDPVGPRREPAAPVEPADVAGDGDHGVLGGVVGVSVLASQAPTDGEEPVVLVVEQGLQRSPVAAGRLGGQRVLVLAALGILDAAERTPALSRAG